ncbi:MAG: DeoR/GlpR transcriptional regulator, partial [Rhodospirillaceae bacterium]|nr:DeoR/GlpR transcriptional regulator [Rhodospirillaceae bacterium]
ETLEFIRRFRVRHAILSIGAVNAAQGFMDHYLCEAEFSRAAMAQAQHRIVAADSSKFDRSVLVQVCPLDAVDLLVTDALPGQELTQRLEAADLEIQVAEPTQITA